MKNARGGLIGAALVVGLGLPLGVIVAGGPEINEPRVLSLRTTDDASIVGPVDVTSTTVATPPETTAPPPAPSRPPAEVKVRVHNGSTKAGGALRFGERLKGLGYNVVAPGPSPKSPGSVTQVLFRPGFEAEARALAAGLGAPDIRIDPLGSDPLFAGSDAAVVVVAADDVVA